MSKHKRLIFLSYSLLVFEIVEFCTSNTSPDELNIPYVPYVVVEKKDELDLDRVQQTIFKYLENRSQRHAHAQEQEEPEQSTTLYDYLRSSTSTGRSTGVYDYLRTTTRTNAPYQDKPIDTRNSKLHPLNFHTPNYVHMDAAPTTYRGHLPYRYETTPVYNLSSPSISKSYDTYATRYYPGVTDISAQETKFVPLKESVYTSMQEGSLMGYHIPKKEAEYPPFNNNLPFGGSMKCSLRSSRYVYDGECKSKKPIVETVCADRCIKYDYNKLNQPYHSASPYLAQHQNPTDTQKPVVALACKDGDVKKQKIKLYCKDGTIINNVIRIVNSCICQEHSEKVHAKKKSVMPVENFRKRTYSRRTLPKVQMFPRYK